MAKQTMTYGWEQGRFILIVRDESDAVIAKISMNAVEAKKVYYQIARPYDQRVFVLNPH